MFISVNTKIIPAFTLLVNFYLALFDALLYNKQNMKITHICLIIFLGVFPIACTTDSSWPDYQKLKSSSLSGSQLMQALIDFEIKHTKNFESKVDLASYYASIGDIRKTEEYLKRAESVLSFSHNSDEGKKIRAVYYGTWAHIRMIQGDYKEALSYADKAIKTHTQASKPYMLLKAQLFYVQKENDKASALFEQAIKTVPELFKPEDMRAYMYLLAEAGKTEEALHRFEQYLTTGEYYEGLGLFGSTLCEKLGKTEESVLYAFADYEFARKTYETDPQFLQNLYALEQTLQKSGTGGFIIDFVRSYFDSSIPYESFSVPDIFIGTYIVVKNRLRDKRCRDSDLQTFLQLEPYLKRFPSYYWTLYQLFDFFQSGSAEYNKTCLEKCIYLSPASVYADFARTVLALETGLTENQAQYLLLPAEVEYLITRYEQSGNQANITAVLDFLNLPDNAYVYTAVMLLREYRHTVFVADLQNRYPEKITPKIKERLHVITQR